MEMTIAEPIQTLEYLRDSGVFPFSTKEGVLYTTESIDVAIATMRKYQKIEELVEYHMLRYLSKKNKSGFYKDILEVLDNENDD